MMIIYCHLLFLLLQNIGFFYKMCLCRVISANYIQFGGHSMKKLNFTLNAYKIATALSSILCAVLFVCANTNSCGMIHQPEAPDSLSRFSKVE